MASCPICHAVVADDSRFCASCGAPLAAAPRSAARPHAGRRERRIVTSLFCDLVGFTAQSETADPEDLDRMLGEYFVLAREAIERHGGIVEKFIGDAVVGVFGLPVSHEDDPARAVRAGLAICAGAATLATAGGEALRLRVGVNTGETLVHLDVDPGSGEHLFVGDAVNTAARIQSAAPELGVAVGLETWEATSSAFDYLELPPATLKGKADPVRIFHARAERATRGSDPGRTHVGGYVGRRAELARLRQALEDVSASGQPRLAVIAGEPGIGKSRLLAELASAAARDQPDLTWRQGRCLPYGDGTGFWALGEIVKTHASILEDDDEATASTKLRATLDGLDDADWLHDRLLPLVGSDVGSGPAVGSEERSSAWARYLGSMTGAGVGVIALEDVHWADTALLDFVETLAAGDARLLVVVTTRPSVWDAVPAFAGGDDVLRFDLRPLDAGETEALIVGLLGSIVPDALQAPILRLSQGNPLFAQELVRLLRDRGLLERRDGTFRLREGATIPLPGSIHGLIASRLDALSAGERVVLTRASIIGAVFWPDAVAALGDEDAPWVSAQLERLAARELVRAGAASPANGSTEYAFAHILVRDVAYGALPRGDRLDGHLAAAAWIRANGGRDDVAGIVAHHLATAHELAVAARDHRAETTRHAAVEALALAAEHARGLDAAVAFALYERAVALSRPGDERRTALLVAFGGAATAVARHAQAIAAQEEALAAYRQADDDEGIARTLITLNPSLQAVQDRRWVTNPDEALRRAETLGPSSLLVDALLVRGGAALWDWSWKDAAVFAQRAIEVAGAIGIEPPPGALVMRGRARLAAGDREGLVDSTAAVDAAVAAGRWDLAAGILASLATDFTLYVGYPQAEAATMRGIALADAHGLRSLGLLHRTNRIGMLFDTGRLDEALPLIEEIEPEVLRSGDVINATYLASWRAEIALIRGDSATATGLLGRILALADSDPEQDDFNLARLGAAAILERLGERQEALRLLRQVVATHGPNVDFFTVLIARLAVALGEPDLVEVAIAKAEWDNRLVRCNAGAARALVAEARGASDDASSMHVAAAAAWEDFGMPVEAARSWLGAARSLVAAGRGSEAAPAIAAARAVFEPLRAAPSLAELLSLEQASTMASPGTAGDNRTEQAAIPSAAEEG